MPALYVTEHGATLRHESHRLIVEKDDRELASMPLEQVEAVVMAGNAVVTMPTMKLLLFKGIDTAFVSAHGAYCGRLVGPLSRNGQLRQAQYAAAQDESLSLEIARACVVGKLKNMRTLLLRYNRTLQNSTVLSSIERIEAQLDDANRGESKPTLRGLEGAGSAAYFTALPLLFKRDWGFAKRVRRPPTDPINVMLRVSYTLLLRAIEAAVNIVGLDPYIGFLHEPSYGRASLALDLMEEFRPIVADSLALRCLNSDLITPNDFTPGDDPGRPIVLSQTGFKRLIGEFEARLETEFQHPDSDERVTYRRCFELQARAMAAAVRGRRRYTPLVVR
jgi:CRISPR-associated protein Cas1